jgi:phosphoglycerate dehydrogenase-like enzyme
LEKDYNITYESLDDLLIKSDFVSIHTPLNEKTHKLIEKQQLEQMKKNSYLINKLRGPVVDEAALYEVLKKRTSTGASLEVFEKEPIDPSNRAHIASACIETHTPLWPSWQ